MSDYLNGSWTDGPARVAAADRGFLLGDGLFETLAVRGGRVWRVARHLARLRAGAAVLDIPVTADDAELAAAIRDTAGRNGVVDGLVRLTLTRGAGAGGLVPAGPVEPTLLVSARARPVDDGPLRAVIARTTRRNELSPLAGIKSTSYLDGIIAQREAAARGAAAALLLNTRGRVAEGAIANIFARVGGRLVTPPVGEGALPGIMRAAVMALGDVFEAPLTEADLAGADEVMLTNSAGVRALVEIDGRPVGDGRPGALTTALQSTIWNPQEESENG